MLTLKASGLGKKFVRHWVFRNLDFEWQTGSCVAITGGNGSGKSTLIQVVSGALPPTEGQLDYFLTNSLIELDHWYKCLSLASPALELPDTLSLRQLLAFHLQLKPVEGGLPVEAVAEKLDLKNELDKDLRLFSSGMRQRVKLGLALWADAPLIMLDEPTSHLDAHYTAWYLAELDKVRSRKLVLIASNDPIEYPDADIILRMDDLKPR